MLLSNFVVCNSKNSKFIKEQEASGLSNSLGIKAHLIKFPYSFLIYFISIQQVNTRYKTNEIVSKFL